MLKTLPEFATTDTNSVLMRGMELGDAAEVARLERSMFDPPWTEELLTSRVLSYPEDNYILEFDGIAGFAICQFVRDECEIIRFGVRRDLRRRGLGMTLLRSTLDLQKQRGVQTVYLEVRRFNIAAIALYQRAGFKHTGIRKNYYKDLEDAVLMGLSLKEG